MRGPWSFPPASLQDPRSLGITGARETDTVRGTEILLSGCLTPPKPITIEPLDPPVPGAGAQFVLPTGPLPKESEQEVCFATYYDIGAQVPAAYQDPTGKYLRYFGQEVRRDPQSYHLVLMRAGGDGVCDACRITGGESTASEMFPIGEYSIERTRRTSPRWTTERMPVTENQSSFRACRPSREALARRPDVRHVVALSV